MTLTLPNSKLLAWDVAEVEEYHLQAIRKDLKHYRICLIRCKSLKKAMPHELNKSKRKKQRRQICKARLPYYKR